ncbi:MAG: hypothetical protein NC434_13970 [Ruminococcus sp.]|nr:hypothetical protein [Ruminococcus sp.]
MGTIEKGVILTLEGNRDRNKNYTKAKVQAASAEGTSTLPLSIPWYLRGNMGSLEKGTEVVYAVFDDQTGVILSRLDGSWDGCFEESALMIDTQGHDLQIEGNINVSEGITGNRIVIQNEAVLPDRGEME